MRFSGERRITIMRVALVASILVLFLPPGLPVDGTAIFLVSDEIGGGMPYLLLLAAVGSQTSAVTRATRSSDLSDPTG